MPSIRERLVGTWKLIRMQHIDAQGNLFYPMGEGALGQLIYSADGYMSGTLMRADRKPFKATGLFDGTDEEKKGAMETFLSYCGPYRVEGDKVIHVVEMSLFPNWVGNEEVRFVKFQDDKLCLTTPSFRSKGVKQHGEIWWRRP